MVQRVNGLASGMDIQGIIDDLMKAERVPLDNLEKDKQVLEWQQEDYRAINTQVDSFRQNVFELKLERTFNVKKAASSNENVVEVSGSSSALTGTNSIVVTQLAEGAYKTSSAAIGSNADKTTLATQLGLTGNISFSINGKSVSINADTEDMNDLVEKINEAGAGVQASYDSTLDRFFLSTTETGSAANITITDDSSGLFSKLKINTDAVSGKDAQFTLNGADFTMASNEFTINGLTYSLKGVSSKNASNEYVSTNISVEADTDQIYKTVMDFVDLYNETIDKINDELNETKYDDYEPLTDSEREELDDDQIEKWTENAKSGLLKSDSILTGTVSSFRRDVYSAVEGLSSDFNSLADIGITTGKYYEQGKLYVDEDALKEAIEKDPEAIKKLFTATSDDDNDNNEGIAVRLYNDSLKAISNITEKAGASSSSSEVDDSAIGKRLKEIDEDIDTWEDRLDDIEDRYWTKYTAMEEAISQMNSQSSYLSSLLGTNSSS